MNGSEGSYTAANRFRFTGSGIRGSVETTSVTGELIGSIVVDGEVGTDFALDLSPDGVLARFQLGVVPDGPSRSVAVLLPDTYVGDGQAEFEGLAIIVTKHGSMGAPGLTAGPVQHYEARPVSGDASSSQS